MKLIGVIIAIVFVLGALGYGSFVFKRWWHYSIAYEGKVAMQICDSVKHEYLIDPSRCK